MQKFEKLYFWDQKIMKPGNTKCREDGKKWFAYSHISCLRFTFGQLAIRPESWGPSGDPPRKKKKKSVFEQTLNFKISRMLK